MKSNNEDSDGGWLHRTNTTSLILDREERWWKGQLRSMWFYTTSLQQFTSLDPLTFPCPLEEKLEYLPLEILWHIVQTPLHSLTKPNYNFHFFFLLTFGTILSTVITLSMPLLWMPSILYWRLKTLSAFSKCNWLISVEIHQLVLTWLTSMVVPVKNFFLCRFLHKNRVHAEDKTALTLMSAF